MARDLLTREELSLLLADDNGSPDGRSFLPDSGSAPFSPEDFATLQKMLATYVIPGVTAWSVLFGRSVELADPEISLVTSAALSEMEEAVVGTVDFVSGLKGRAQFVLPIQGARVLVGLALGSPEPSHEFDLIHRSSFASVLKYLLAEMRSLISRGTGRRVGTAEPVIRLWPAEVLPEPGHLVQARIPWWVDGVEHPGLLFWADLELTRGLLSLAGPKPRPGRSPGESAWIGESVKSRSAPPLGGGRGSGDARGSALESESGSAVPRGLARMGAGRMRGGARGEAPIEEPPPSASYRPDAASSAAPAARRAPQQAPTEAAGPEESLSIWSLGRASSPGVPGPQAASSAPPASFAPLPPAPAGAMPPSGVVTYPAPAPFNPPAPVRPAEPLPVRSENAEREVRVELGRSVVKKQLTLGQVVTLDRLAGESVDVYVDGQLAARGEVTVDGEVLAVRVTQVMSSRRGPDPDRDR